MSSARRDVASSLSDVRRLVYSLGDPTLASLGLEAAIRAHVQSLTQGTGLRLTVEIDGLPDLPAALEEAAYRIVAESVTNVTRHAHALCCLVRMECTDGSLAVHIEDDGDGIASDAPIGVGRRSMKDRAAELGGRIDIRQGPEGGTIVRLELPLGAPS